MPGKLHIRRGVPFFGETRKDVMRLDIYHGRRRIGSAMYRKKGTHLWKWAVYNIWGFVVDEGEMKSAEGAKAAINTRALDHFGRWG